MPRLSTATRAEILNNTRQKLLDSAAAEFAVKGFTGANINRISIAAGFAKGTIYNYFPSKRNLMLALIDEIAANHTNFIVEQVASEVDPTQRLKGFFSAGFAFVEQYPEQAQVAINAVYGYDQEFKQRIYEAYQDLFDLIVNDIVGYGTELGDFNPGDPNSVAALLMSIYLGGSSLLGPNGRVWFDPEQVAAFVMDGLRQRDSSLEIGA